MREVPESQPANEASKKGVVANIALFARIFANVVRSTFTHPRSTTIIDTQTGKITGHFSSAKKAS
jgi:hypothetical protein